MRVDPIERAGPRLGGIGVNGAIPFVTSGGVRPLAEAILFRVFKKVPRTADPVVFLKARALLRESWFLGGIFTGVQRMDIWEWLLSFRKRRRRVALIKAWHQYRQSGLP